MIMNSEHRRFLGKQLAISAVLNAAICALFVWLMFGNLDAVPLWGLSGLAVDLIPTTFMITLMTGVALTLASRSAVRSGKLAGLQWRARMPRNALLRGLLLAAIAVSLLVPFSIALLSSVWTLDWSFRTVMLFKVVYGVVLGSLVTPLVVLAALGDPEH